MTQHYQRTAMAPTMPGMPIIPPRLQQQQQQELLINNRRQHPQLYQHHQQQYPQQQYPQQQYPQQQYLQQHHQQQQYQVRPTGAGGGGPLPFTGHTRSVSNGGGSAALPNTHNNNNRSGGGGRPLNGPSGYPHQQPTNYGNNTSGYNYQQQQQGLGGRLRSESNPSYSSHNNNSNPSSPFYSAGDRNGIPNRANSSTAAPGSSFKDRMKERDRERQGREREREEREAATARAIHEDSKPSSAATTSTTITAAAAKEAAVAAAATAQNTGTALWNRMRAAKDAINVAITGEERWPDSDDSDHEGESHVSRVLREYNDKKKIEELDQMPISQLMSNSSTGSNYSSSRNRTLRDAIRQEHGGTSIPTSLASSASSSDYLVRSRRARGETGHQPSRSEDSSSAPFRPIRTREIGQKSIGALSPPASPGSATPTPTSPTDPSASLETPRIGNRFRTSSDASLSAALGRLEGKRNQDALVAQVSYLGSTRARSPHRGNRAYREHIDVAPPPPLPTPKSDYRQQRQPLSPSSSSPSLKTLKSSPSLPSLSSLSSSRKNGAPVDLGAYGQRQQQQTQQQTRYI